MKNAYAIVVLAALAACDAKPAPEPEVLQLAPTEETTAAIRRILAEPPRPNPREVLERGYVPCHEMILRRSECEGQ